MVFLSYWSPFSGRGQPEKKAGERDGGHGENKGPLIALDSVEKISPQPGAGSARQADDAFDDPEYEAVYSPFEKIRRRGHDDGGGYASAGAEQYWKKINEPVPAGGLQH